MKTTFIYKLLDPVTLKIRYIGKANNPEKRLKKHIQNCSQVNCHRNNWLRKLKTNNLIPIMEIIEECNLEVWQEREKYWIKYYENEPLTNSTSGGDGLNNPTKEVKEKILKSLIGRKHSEETKKKMSLASMGNKKGCKKALPIRQICLITGETVNVYKSIKEASKALNGSSSSFCRILRNTKKEYRNYK